MDFRGGGVDFIYSRGEYFIFYWNAPSFPFVFWQVRNLLLCLRAACSPGKRGGSWCQWAETCGSRVQRRKVRFEQRCCKSQVVDERKVRWEAGTKTAHRVSDRKGLDFPTYSDSIRRCSGSISIGDCWYHLMCEQKNSKKWKQEEILSYWYSVLKTFHFGHTSGTSQINHVRTEELRKVMPSILAC